MFDYLFYSIILLLRNNAVNFIFLRQKQQQINPHDQLCCECNFLKMLLKA